MSSDLLSSSSSISEFPSSSPPSPQSSPPPLSSDDDVNDLSPRANLKRERTRTLSSNTGFFNKQHQSAPTFHSQSRDLDLPDTEVEADTYAPMAQDPTSPGLGDRIRFGSVSSPNLLLLHGDVSGNELSDNEKLKHQEAAWEKLTSKKKPMKPDESPSSNPESSSIETPLGSTLNLNLMDQSESSNLPNLFLGRPLHGVTADDSEFFIEDCEDDSNSPRSQSRSSKSTVMLCRQTTETTEATNTTTTRSVELLHLSSNTNSRTGVFFEPSHKHFDPSTSFHKERPARVVSIRDHLVKVGLVNFENPNESKLFVVRDNCDVNNGQEGEIWLNQDVFESAHLPAYLSRLSSLQAKSQKSQSCKVDKSTLKNGSFCACSAHQPYYDQEALQYKSIYLNADSVHCAKLAAQGLCELIDEVCAPPSDGISSRIRLKNAFALIRPPGHHAEPSLAGGYCILNNVALAAKYALSKPELKVKKVLIVDWDVHHGNGTQEIFIGSSDVLYFSVHRYDGGNYFPFLSASGPTVVGNGKGVGHNVNVGWNKKGLGDLEYEAVWEKILIPIARQFQPDLILVSAGFDAADKDMGELNVTPRGFGMLTKRLIEEHSNVPLAMTLEGGYLRGVLSKCVEECLRIMANVPVDKDVKGEEREGSNDVNHDDNHDDDNDNDDDNEDDGDDDDADTYDKRDILEKIDQSARRSIEATIEAHSSHWKF